MGCFCIGCLERMREDEEEDLQRMRDLLSKKREEPGMVSYPTSPVRMEAVELIGSPHTRQALVPPSSLPMLPMPRTTCPACEAPSSVMFTREEERFPYGGAPHTVELTALVDKGHCSACTFEFTDYRAEEARDKAVQLHRASIATEGQT